MASRQAYDVGDALLIESMFIVAGERQSVLSMASGAETLTLRCLCEHAVRESRPYTYHSQDCKFVCRILLPPKDGKPEVCYGRMAHLVEQHEQHIADNKFHRIFALLLRQFPKSRMILEVVRNLD